MGQFRFEFQGMGGHGCERKAKPGEKFYPCKRMGCPDCECKRFVEHMRALGFMSGELADGTPAGTATFTHWPGQPDEVVDDLGSDPYAPIRKSGEFK